MKKFLLILGGIILFMWIMSINDLVLMKGFMPAREQIRRETFEQSKAYRQGLIQELQNMQFEYIQADDEHKKALGFLIKQRAVDVDPSILPTDLKQFIRSLP